jgi:hypothetical protein
MYQVFSGQKPPFSRAGMPPAYGSLIEDCWAADPDARPSFGAILQRLRGMYSEERARLAALTLPPEQQPPEQQQQPAKAAAPVDIAAAAAPAAVPGSGAAAPANGLNGGHSAGS